MASPETPILNEPRERRRRHAAPIALGTPLVITIVILLVAGIGVTAFLSAKLALVVLLVLTVAVILAALPKTAVTYLLGFVALLFLIPSALTVTGPLRSVGQPSTIIGWGAGLLWIACRLHVDSGLDRRRNPARWTVLAFATVIVLAFGVAYTRPLTSLEISGTVRSVAKLAAYIGIGLFTMDTLRTRKEIDRVLMGVVLGATFSALMGLIEFRTSFNYTTRLHIPGLVFYSGGVTGDLRQGLHRVTGTAHHPIEFAVTLCTTLPLALHYAVHLPRGRLRSLMRFATVILAIAVPTSVSRTGVVGFVIAFAVVAVDWTWRRRANVAAAGIVGVVAVSVAVPRLIGSARGLFEHLGTSNSIKGRTSDYTHVEPYLHGHLLLGRGQGTFQVGQYFTLDDQYLNTLLAAGLVGLAAVIALYLTIIFLGRGARKRGRDQVDRSLGQALAAGGFVLAFSAATFDLFGFTQAVGLTFILLGVSGAFWRITWCERQELERAVDEGMAVPDLALTR